MNLLARVLGRITEFFTTQTDMLSRTVRVTTRRMRSAFREPSHDWSRPDYAYWRRAYWCRVRGLEISGLFIRPLISKITGWALGMPPLWRTDDEASTEALSLWWQDHHDEILRISRAAQAQGDAFAVVNADLTLTALPPDAVDPIVADDDYSHIIGWRVTQILAHPETTDKMTVVDEYYADRRIQRTEINGVTTQERVYRNLLGRLPIVHIANQRQDGEAFGHAEAEALIELLLRYGEVIDAAIEGNITQGRPTPVASFETIGDLDKFWELYGERTVRTLPDGSTETIDALNVDLSQLLTLSGATFEYKSPGAFTADTERLLGLLFYLLLEHAEIPEFVFGNAISSSQASADTQMPVFERFIEMRRADMTGWLTEIAEIALGYMALTQPGIRAQTPALQWTPLTQDGRLTLDTLSWALLQGLIDERTALTMAPLDIQDADAVLEQARAERAERASAWPETQPDELEFERDLRNQIERLEA